MLIASVTTPNGVKLKKPSDGSTPRAHDVFDDDVGRGRDQGHHAADHHGHTQRHQQSFAFVSGIRGAHPVFRRRLFFTGSPVRQRGAEGLPDISWFHRDGSQMSDDDWKSRLGKSVARLLNGLGHPRASTRADDGSPTIRSCCASTLTMSRGNSFFLLESSGRYGFRSSTPRRSPAAGRIGTPSTRAPK
jgi:hypothetical protein